MERLTFDGNFCDIAMCFQTPGGSYCEDGACSQKKVWERLKTYEDAEDQGWLMRLPCKIGDEIRATVSRPYNGNTATIHGTVSDIQAIVRVIYNQDRHIDFLSSDFGKTVFPVPENEKGAAITPRP